MLTNWYEYKNQIASDSKKMQLYAGAWYIHPIIATGTLSMGSILSDTRKNCEILYNLVPSELKKNATAQPSRGAVFMQQFKQRYANFKKLLANATLLYRQRVSLSNRYFLERVFMLSLALISAPIVTAIAYVLSQKSTYR